MMKTVSLELAKELKANNFPQESHFKWLLGISGEWKITDVSIDDAWLKKRGKKQSDSIGRVIGEGLINDNLKAKGEKYENLSIVYAAPTAEEILEKLPVFIRKNKFDYYLTIYRQPNLFELDYVLSLEGKSCILETFEGNSLSEVAGLMYLYLAKEGLLKTG